MVNPDDLPISIHEHVLGVDITVHQQAIWKEVHGDGHDGGLEPDIETEAYGERNPRFHPRQRKYLARWARRNLFEGHPE